MNRPIIIASLLLLVASNGWTYNETDLAKLKATGTCEGCDLSGAILSYLNLGGANLSGANLSGANLREASFSMLANLSGADLRGADFTDARLGQIDLDGAIYCKTKIRREERNDHCEE